MEMQTFQALRYDSLESHIMVDQPTLHRCPMNYSMCETATLTSTTPRSTFYSNVLAKSLKVFWQEETIPSVL